MRRTLAVLAAAVWLLAATPVLPQATAAPSACEGVWVVVDATALGGTVSTGCAPEHATGAQALASAGFSTARSSTMICQIDDRPDRCEVAASAYWSYWQATPEGERYGDWVYANLGADSYHPRGGDAEGWVFGDGSAPPSSLPGTLAVAGASATPEAAATPSPAVTTTPPQPDGSVAGGPLGLAAVAGVAALAGLGIWVSRRRSR
ncbi:MAG: hypothetical protein AAGC63_08730 [Propionicimonas sp.]|nr:hypothetical protein [Propionicimonas sp.]